MNSVFPRLRRAGALCLAAAMIFSSAVFAEDVEVNESDSQAEVLVESDVPIEVGDLVTGSALGVGTVTTLSANVRDNPNMDANVIHVLNQNEQVVILSQDGDWYRVSGEDFDGFVSVDLMSLEKEGTGDLGYAVAKSDSVTVYTDSAETSETVANVTTDDVVEINGVSDGWYEVSVNGETGYVRSEDVDPTADIPAERIYDYAVVAASGVYLRSSDSSNSSTTDMLVSGSRCELIQQSGDWYEVSYHGETGYINSSYVTETNDSSMGSTELETSNETTERLAEEAAAAAAAAEEAAAKAASTPSSSTPSTSTPSSTTTPSTPSTPSYGGTTSSSIVSTAYQYLGTPYVWGGTTPSGFDCSGFTQYVFNLCGYSIGRTAADQYNYGSYVSGTLQSGDLVFFANTYGSGITHVGIYVGDGNFIHCANGGVKVTSLSSSYYASRYYGARRL